MLKPIEIEANLVAPKPASTTRFAPFIEITVRGGYLHLASGPGYTAARFNVQTAAEARELAQQMRGAADALLDLALTQEQPQNFAADWPAITPGEKAIEKIAAAEVPA